MKTPMKHSGNKDVHILRLKAVIKIVLEIRPWTYSIRDRYKRIFSIAG